MTTTDRRFTARYTHDEDGYWSGEVLEEPGCRSFGKSLHEAERRTRQALAGWLENFENLEVPDPAGLDIVTEVAVDTGEAGVDLSVLVRQRRDLERLQSEVTRDTKRAAEALLRQGLTVRDVASALGISPARVQQIARKAPAARSNRPDTDTRPGSSPPAAHGAPRSGR